jgi:YidC/Oxa1 family membrane protein insertase
MNDNFKSFCVAIVLSVLVVSTMNYFLPPAEVVDAPEVKVEAPVEEMQVSAEPVFVPVDEALQNDARIKIKNQAIEGTLRLKGGRFDDLRLTKYKKTLESNSENIELLLPSKTENAFFAEYGWLSADKNLNLPNSNTVWELESGTDLTPDSPIVLRWDNGQGLIFRRKISVDENYLFTVKQMAENNTDKAVSLIPYALMSKYVDLNQHPTGIVHEGFTAIVDGDLKEYSFKDLHESKFDKKLEAGEGMPEDKNAKTFENNGGWVSLTEKYWFGAFIFPDEYKTTVNVRNVMKDVYQLDFKGEAIEVPAGACADVTTEFYAGAKEIKLLDKYAENIKKFDLAVDFGWYYFLTKPFFYILDFLYNLIGNMGWAILLFAFILRALLFPIANKSFDSMSKMKKIQPKIMALQEMYKNDKVALQRATMELYKREKVNPASGCLPMFIQIPIFFSLYKVLNISLEIRHAPFIGWIKDLSAPDPLTISAWSGVHIPALLDIGVWPIIYGITMYLQQKLNPAPTNKDQARMFAMMPIIFTIMFAHFAVGLVIYWTLSNILSMLQQKLIMRKNGVK